MTVAASKTIIRAVVPKTVVATIDRMAKASDKSRSAVVAEFLVGVEPQLRRLAGMLEVAKAQQSLFPKAAVAELEAALDQLSGDAAEVMNRLEGTLGLPLEGEKRKSVAARPRASRAGKAARKGRKTPGLVTRG